MRKPVPDCSRYGLTWVPSSQRCEHLDCIEQIMNVLDRQQESDGLMGLIATGGGGAAGGAVEGGASGAVAGPVGVAVGAIVGAIQGLIGSARQRGSDEARSGVALQISIDAIYYLKDSVQAGEISPKDARDIFRTKVMPAFLNFILTLTTKSVVESRMTNQKRDLENLFEKEVGSLPDLTTAETSDDEGYLPVDPNDSYDDLDLGFTEYYDDQGGYYYEDESGWYYEDASGNWQQQDAEGNLYAGNYGTGEYWQTLNGETYWEGPDGSYYEEYSDGTWTSGDANGNQCDGDAAGNWVCEDGTGGGDWRQSPARTPKQQGQTRRQTQVTQQSTFDKYLKQVIALIPKQQRATQNAQRAASARGQAQASAAQERLRASGPIGSSSAGSSSGIDTTSLLLIGGVLLVFMFMRR